MQGLRSAPAASSPTQPSPAFLACAVLGFGFRFLGVRSPILVGTLSKAKTTKLQNKMSQLWSYPVHLNEFLVLIFSTISNFNRTCRHPQVIVKDDATPSLQKNAFCGRDERSKTFWTWMRTLKDPMLTTSCQHGVAPSFGWSPPIDFDVLCLPW